MMPRWAASASLVITEDAAMHASAQAFSSLTDCEAQGQPGGTFHCVFLLEPAQNAKTMAVGAQAIQNR
jgi:hypothetical protein